VLSLCLFFYEGSLNEGDLNKKQQNKLIKYEMELGKGRRRTFF